MLLLPFQVVGPQAGTIHNYGTYAPNYNEKYATTPYDGLKKLGKTSVYAQGCTDLKCQHYNATQVISTVTDADLVFVTLGLGKYHCAWLV